MGLFSGITDLFSGYVDNYYNRKAAKKQYDYQMAMWNANNAYNTPKEQMERLEEAGLNKNLIYGGGSATHTATMASAPKVTPGRLGLDSQSLLRQASMENLVSQNDFINAQAAYHTELGRKATADANIAEKQWETYRDTGILQGSTGGTAGAFAGASNTLFGYTAGAFAGASNTLFGYTDEKDGRRKDAPVPPSKPLLDRYADTAKKYDDRYSMDDGVRAMSYMYNF